MASVEERLRLIEELRLAKERAERAEEERQRAEEEGERRLEEERQRADKEAQRRLAEEKRTRPTTLSEYLEACDHNLATALLVETNMSLTSTADTRPEGRKCPASLRPWSRFVKHRNKVWHRFLKLYPFDSDSYRHFQSVEKVKGIAEQLKKTKIANESNLVQYLEWAVEKPVSDIIEYLITFPNIRDAFNLGDGVTFTTNPHMLKDPEDDLASPPPPSSSSSSSRYVSSSEGASVLTSAPPSPSTPSRDERSRPSGRAPLDRMCIRIDKVTQSRGRTLACLAEYKPPHRLTVPRIKEGLKPMDILEEVVKPVEQPAKSEEVAFFQFESKERVAKAITQTYDYMIRMGVQYGYITTGKAYIFLHVRKDDPSTLYYHLTVPEEDVEEEEEEEEDGRLLPLQTAVGQILTFCLLALGSRPRTRRWRKQVLEELHEWEIIDTERLAQVDDPEPKTPKGDRPFPGSRGPNPEFSPAVTRSKRKYQSSESCRPRSNPTSRRDESPSGSSDEQTPTADIPASVRGTRARQKASRSSRGQYSDRSTRGGRTRPYCTQKCLLGLVRREKLDPKCPNISLHSDNTVMNGYHPVNRKTLLALFKHQFSKDLDHDCDSLDIQGARGALFWVCLRPYGYTMVAKGTVAESIRHLRHEWHVYKRLRELQGVSVPVCLGSIDLVDPYYYDLDVDIVHMTFLAWAGGPLRDAKFEGTDGFTQGGEMLRSLQEIHDAGVLHEDVRWPNVLWSAEAKRAMLIDFERSKTITLRQQRLSAAKPDLKQSRSGSGRIDRQKSVDSVSQNTLEGLFPFQIEMARATALFA